MFRRQHIIILFCFAFTFLVLIFVRFSLCLILDLINLGDRGTDTVSIRLVGFCVCDRPNGSTEECVRLHLCLLVSTLDCQVFVTHFGF